MEKLGLVRRPEDDFDHPGVPPTWSGRRHVLYRITREQWRFERGLNAYVESDQRERRPKAKRAR